MRRIAVPLITLAFAAACAACSAAAAPDPGPRFDDEAQALLTCLSHQAQPPGPRYTDDGLRRTDETLALLRYYTANGHKPYCDGAGPTSTDLAWTRVYTQLGAARSNLPG